MTTHISPLFLQSGRQAFHCTGCYNAFPHSAADGQTLGGLYPPRSDKRQTLEINRIALHMCVHLHVFNSCVSMLTETFDCMGSIWLLYGNCFPKWLDHFILIPARRVLVAPYPYQHMVLPLFLLFAILMDVGCVSL